MKLRYYYLLVANQNKRRKERWKTTLNIRNTVLYKTMKILSTIWSTTGIIIVICQWNVPPTHRQHLEHLTSSHFSLFIASTTQIANNIDSKNKNEISFFFLFLFHILLWCIPYSGYSIAMYILHCICPWTCVNDMG